MATKRRELTLDRRWRVFYDYVLLMIGCLLIALSFNMLLNPNQVATGGVTGISTIIHFLYGLEPAIVQWMLNIPLFLAGVLLLGRQFGVKTALGSIVLPLFVYVTKYLPPLTNNLLLATVFGGIGIGAGLGIVFRGRASTGGLDVAAQLVHKYMGISYGAAIAMIDGMVILTAGIVFSPEKAMYALIGLFVTSKTIDIVQLGFRYSKVAFIISEQAETIGRMILQDLDRGLTTLHARGGYTGNEKNVLMVVVSQREVTKLKALVKSKDPSAFVIISNATEVLGEGFKHER